MNSLFDAVIKIDNRSIGKLKFSEFNTHVSEIPDISFVPKDRIWK